MEYISFVLITEQTDIIS